jgi:hypothetical protein
MSEDLSNSEPVSPEGEGLVESIQSEVVDRYANILAFCRGLLKDIEDEDVMPNPPRGRKTVNVLYNMLSTLAPEGKQIDQVMGKIEEEDEDQKGEGKRTARNLAEIKEQLLEMMALLERKHADLLKSGMSLTGLPRFAAGAPDGFGEEVARGYGQEAGEASGIGVKAVSVEKDGEGWKVIVVGESSAMAVLVDGQLRFAGAYPLCGCQPMSYDHYAEVIRPALMRIGHWAPPELGGVLLSIRPEGFSPSEDTLDEFVGYVPGKGPTTYRIYVAGGQETKTRSCRIGTAMGKSASAIPDMGADLARRREKLEKASLVVVRKPGEYQGMGGTVDKSSIVERNDHLEVLVNLKFDTGLPQDLWVTDEDIEVALNG